MKITWQGPWMNFSIWNYLLDLFKRILLIDGHSEILVIRVSSLHFFMTRGNQGNLGLYLPYLQGNEYPNRLSGANTTARPHSPPMKPLSLFWPGCRLPGACCLPPVPFPLSSSFFSLWLCPPACSRWNHLQGEWPTPLEVLGHFSNLALHFNYRSPGFKTLHSPVGHLPFKNTGGHNRSQFYEEKMLPNQEYSITLYSIAWNGQWYSPRLQQKSMRKGQMWLEKKQKTKAENYICLEIGSHVLSLWQGGGGNTRSIETFLSWNMMYSMNWNWFCFSSPRPTPTPTPPFCSERLRQRAPALPERRDVPQQRALRVPGRVHGHPVREAAVRGGGQLRLRLRPGGAPAWLPGAAAAERAAGHRQRSAGLSAPPATSPGRGPPRGVGGVANATCKHSLPT